jgi:plasmid stabilization system protein ParE
MKITFLEEADSEFSAAVAYYDRQEPGLGQRFEDEIDRALCWLIEHPHLCPLRRGIYRRMNLHIFPYYIPYIIRDRLCGLSLSRNRNDDLNIGSGEPAVSFS